MAEPEDGKIPCEVPGCNARVKPAGMSLHLTRAHGGDSEHARAVFRKVAEATRILIPDSDELYLRLEEVVELRKHMIRFLDRGKK